MERRKVTFKLYPNATQAERLTGWIRLHCELYNASLEERIDAYRKHGKSIRYYDQQNVLPEIKAARHAFVELGSHGLQQITRKNGEWFASLTLRVSEDAYARVRTGDAHRGVDFGINDWATFDNGETIANPRFVRNEMPRMADLQRQQARKKRGSIRYKRLGKQVAKVHERIGNVRREFLHKTTTRMVKSYAVIATEELRVNNMSRSAAGTQDNPGRMVKQKAGLNREILSAGLSMAHNMLAYKAVEAGTRLHVSNTLQLKPSQRCAMCWEIVPKTLAQRMHVCTHCAHTAQRDQNAASVVLIDAHTPGTGVAARPKPLARQRAKSKSETRETPATASQDA